MTGRGLGKVYYGAYGSTVLSSFVRNYCGYDNENKFIIVNIQIGGKSEK